MMHSFTDIEAEIIDTLPSVEEALEIYRIAFGQNGRSLQSIYRRWYRSHQKVAAPALEVPSVIHGEPGVWFTPAQILFLNKGFQYLDGQWRAK